jgi:hypothetical protein
MSEGRTEGAGAHTGRGKKERATVEMCIDPERATIGAVASMRRGGVPMPRREDAPQPPAKRAKGFVQEAEEDERARSEVAEGAPLVPQVKLVGGRIQIDRESLSATPTETGDRGPVTYESARGKIRTSYNSRKGPIVRWTPAETELFYRALRMCGTDFSLMELLLPGRSRAQIHAKYKKEEKDNPRLIERALQNRLDLGACLGPRPALPVLEVAVISPHLTHNCCALQTWR